MRQGIIADLLDYYQNPAFKDEISRALDEFFGFGVKKAGFLEIEHDEVNGLFNEWLVYDFKMINGKTLLEDFCEFNHFNLVEEELKDYQEILENKYAMFEVLRVRWHKSLELRDLQTGKEYLVKEKLGTEQAKIGYIFFGRVGKVGNHWELIGADGPALPMKIGEGARKYFSEMKGSFSPKEIYEVFYKKDGEKKETKKSEEKNPEKAKSNFHRALEKLELESFISAETVNNWIGRSEYGKNTAGYLNLIYGLLDKRRKYGKDEINELIAAFNDFHNTIHQKRLGDKSPNELKEKQKEGEEDWRFDVTAMGTGEWAEHQYEAFEYFRKNDPEKAMEYYNKCFESLLENKMTEREIYRIFANKATTHFQLGEEEEGVALLKIALELNPNYDFAQKTLKKYEKGEFGSMIQAGMMAGIEKRMKDPKFSFNKWDFEAIENDWPAEKILAELKRYGIEADEKEFRKIAEECQSADDLSKKYFFERYKIKDENSDFVSMAAYGLWRVWCSDIPSEETFSRKIEEFWDTVFDEEDDVKKKKTEEELEYFEETTDRASLNFFKKWRKMGNYRPDIINLSTSLGNLVGTSLEERALKLAENLKEKTGNNYFDAVAVCSAAYHNKDWLERMHELFEVIPYEYDIALEVAGVFSRLENELLEKECLEIALMSVEKRDRDKAYDLEESRETIYEDYENVIERLDEFYGETGNEKEFDRVKKLRREIKSRKEELSKSERNDGMIERMAEFEEKMFKKRFEKDPANRYFKFLKKMGINFATEELTNSSITIIAPRGKIGRNDPCPCGSGRKYKKCCLK